jgi:Zn-dependent peptidase ImmA (M78 family)
MTNDVFKAPYLTLDVIKTIANNFLEKYHPECSIPVPIEDIIELKLNIDVILLNGLKQELDVEGFIANNLKKIYIDEWSYSNRIFRTRFTLAHEIGHSILHKDLYKSLKIDTSEDWKFYFSCIDPREYSFFEWHANTFAGFILVPTKALNESFASVISLYKSEGYDPRELFSSEVAIGYISTYLSRRFEVSSEVIKRRLKNEGLIG